MALTHTSRKDRGAVYITGMGMISSLGGSVAETWSRLGEAQVNATPVMRFDTPGSECQVAAQVSETNESEPGGRRRQPRIVGLAALALEQALEQAGLLGSGRQSLDGSLALWCSTTGAGMECGEKFIAMSRAGKKGGAAAEAVRYQAQYLPHALQETFGLRGPAVTLSNACASGADVVGTAADLIASGRTERIAVGGAETLNELIFQGFSCLRALSGTTCRPFAMSRDGLWLGEGAAFMVLESEKSVRERGAKPLGKIAGYGHGTDLYHVTHPQPEGVVLAEALMRALRQAGVRPSEVAYLNAHGTATLANDGAEAAAYGKVFGEGLGRVAISSVKSSIGHTLGAAGAIEAVVTVEAMRQGRPIPALEVVDPLPEMANSLKLSRQGGLKGRAYVSTNAGFGGANAALVFVDAEA
jgi:3-oxoacyl-[acyl-carrier-protein] synthase II